MADTKIERDGVKGKLMDLTILTGSECVNTDGYNTVDKYLLDAGSGTESIQLFLADGTMIEMVASEWATVTIYSPPMIDAALAEEG